MEVGGLVVGVIGLASLFNNVLDCFNYVHIGKSFGSRFQTSLLKLDNARLRLSRWGDAVGLSGNVDDATSLPSTIASEADRRQAEKMLGQILKLFEDARKISDEFKGGRDPDEQSLLVHNEQTDLDPMTASLHQKMVQLSSKRQNRTTLTKKAKFVLYEEKHLKELIDNITSLTKELVELFPATEKQQQLCDNEVSEFSESFRVLVNAATGIDELLAAGLSEVLNKVNNLNTFHNERSVIQQQGTSTGGRFDMKVEMPR
ncbi:HeLo domain superfamily [Fusarium oxysporum f. sp. vasinfectum]|nr:HeLo domain superfamily [Fusarium oxysporum f. sp. vasinfectum]